jgi:hypothetical protein
MPRLPGRRTVPWLMVLEAALVARDHWGRLEDRDRHELARIVRKSKMRPGQLTERERTELRRIVSQLDLLTAGRRILPLPRGVSGLRRLNRLRRR